VAIGDPDQPVRTDRIRREAVVHRKKQWWKRAAAVLGTVAMAGTGLMAAGPAATAATPKAQTRIDGGVEDGMFSLSCLSGAATPNTGVLAATSYRNALGDVVRILVPWDIATNNQIIGERHCFEQYVADAKTDGAVLEVSLNRDGTPPALSAYTAAVKKLSSFKIAKDISFLTAWNEPNNSAYLPAKNAAAQAAGYFRAARAAFAKHKMSMVAGDFASGVGHSFFETYAKNLGSPWPKIWAIHPYTDITNFEYYMLAGKSAQQAGLKAAGTSKVRQLAEDLRGHGTNTRIWINEIYVDHRADKRPPAGVHIKNPGATCSDKKSKEPCFSTTIQDSAAEFLDGALGADSLPGYLDRHSLPSLGRYIYLRAWSYSTDKQEPDADVLEVNFHTSLYCTLAGSC
jgi:hypothetical protein